MRNALGRRRGGIARRYFDRQQIGQIPTAPRSSTQAHWAAIRLTTSSAANIEDIPQGSVLTAFRQTSG
jgi:hypothetical protein